MSVSMQEVRRLLDPEEPNYDASAALGPEALPHLAQLIRGDDVMLASKATYAASLIQGGAGAVESAAESGNPIIRVAAAAAARNLPTQESQQVLARLSDDQDAGIRKVARKSANIRGLA
ncbi:hypothetical protein [Arthrobacter sp. BE255]|uniref:hypothetical protein n=1 Tax=Arthrobacter sp. BE255 TaxID=2817721 RepID=UPI00285832F6|nr:hypothetical protein [Arthrobacter sp. BE255]MDR7161734.1 HEAT repeat protein [Arthrobacter sp. BE255]